jgi:hypothetical protein
MFDRVCDGYISLFFVELLGKSTTVDALDEQQKQQLLHDTVNVRAFCKNVNHKMNLHLGFHPKIC